MNNDLRDDDGKENVFKTFKWTRNFIVERLNVSSNSHLYKKNRFHKISFSKEKTFIEVNI